MNTLSKAKALTPEELAVLQRLEAILADLWVKRMLAGKPRTRKQVRVTGRKKAAREAAAWWRARRLVKHLAFDGHGRRRS